MFIDELDIMVQSGAGGQGCVSFRRERYVAFGGPDGGDGGAGGSIFLRVNTALNTLLPLRNRRHYRAENGRRGGKSHCTGASGQDLWLDVPRGTMVRDAETGVLIGDLTASDDVLAIAQGGRGGKGNAHFASSTHQTPRYAQEGEPGETRALRLELKVMADVGLVGLPNAGKSTWIVHSSAARPKVSDYPFTTLKPSLGVVRVDDLHSFVVADIPGIIRGASQGAGLGTRFLRHIERTSLLLLLIDPGDPEHTPSQAYDLLRSELGQANPRLLNKPCFVAFTKADLVAEPTPDLIQLQQQLNADGIPYYTISALRGDQMRPLIHDLFRAVTEDRDGKACAEDAVAENSKPDSSGDPLEEI